MLSLGYLINVSVIKTKVGYPVLTNLINGSWLDILTKDVSHNITAAPLAQLSENLHSMQEVLGSNPQNDTTEFHSIMSHNVLGWSFFMSILQYKGDMIT